MPDRGRAAPPAWPCSQPRRFRWLPDLRARLLAAGSADAAELARLSRTLGQAYAEAVEALAAREGLRIELVGSHGQTVYHEHGVTTLQIGEAAELACRLGCPVVADFRQNDIAAGGCGAPLVPIVDHWLLRRPGMAVLALNLGGISNFTVLPPAESTEDVIGFDCGPANMVLDGLVERFTGGREHFDRDGQLAAAGRVDAALLAELLADPLFRQPPPRSLRPRAVRRSLCRSPPRPCGAGLGPGLDRPAGHCDRAFRPCGRRCVHDLCGPRLDLGEVVASGGGARNPELMRRLGVAFAPVPVRTTDEHGLPGDFKEAIAFALLASARIDGIPGNLPSVTGAARPVLLGKISEC